ncbi:MAG: ABC transporter permease subunit [Defluviitaleaceae bacterium]|nr:ABC transporter permease subunit [Defluviitaleaceae bacterium]
MDILSQGLSKLKALSIPILILIVWLMAGDSFRPAILPSFESTMQALIDSIENGMMIDAWLHSMNRIMIATLISVSISVPLGLLSRSFKIVKEIVMPFTNFMRYIPVTTFYPLLIVWLGIDEEMRIAFLFVATFFVFFPSVMLILENINNSLIEKALTSGANKWKMMIHVYIPAASPLLCKSFLSMLSVGFTYMIIAETVNPRHGLGYLMLIGSARGRTNLVFAAILVTILTGAIIDIIGSFIIKKAFRWHFESTKQSV